MENFDLENGIKKARESPQNLRPSSNTIEVCPCFCKNPNKLLLCGVTASPRPPLPLPFRKRGQMKTSPKGSFHRFFLPRHCHQRTLSFGFLRRAMLLFLIFTPTRHCLFGLSARRQPSGLPIKLFFYQLN